VQEIGDGFLTSGLRLAGGLGKGFDYFSDLKRLAPSRLPFLFFESDSVF